MEQHGGSANSIGISQAKSLARQIQPMIGNVTDTIILVSSRQRALDTARIICDYIGRGLSFLSHEVLWSGDGHREDLAGLLELIRPYCVKKIEIIILITHYEYTERFMKYFIENYLKAKLDMDCRAVGYGDAWVLDYDIDAKRKKYTVELLQ